MSNLLSKLPEGHLNEKCNVRKLFSKDFRLLSENFSICCHFFHQRCQICSLCVQRNNLRKAIYFKKILSLEFFPDFEQNVFRLVEIIFQRGCLDCILSVRRHFPRHFFEKILASSKLSVFEQKDFGLLAKVFQQSCQICLLGVQMD